MNNRAITHSAKVNILQDVLLVIYMGTCHAKESGRCKETSNLLVLYTKLRSLVIGAQTDMTHANNGVAAILHDKRC
jgi:hypothetical protein